MLLLLKYERYCCIIFNVVQIASQTPPYDLLSSDLNSYSSNQQVSVGNNITAADVVKIIDGMLWYIKKTH